MQAISFTSQLRMHSVHRHCVLGQVICADREEIDFVGENVRHQGCGGDFDHDAQLDLGNTQLRSNFFDHTPCCTPFRNICHHREHDPQFAMYGSPQDCPKLFSQQFGLCQTQTDATHTQKRVFFRRHSDVRQWFIPAHVQRADNDRVILHGFGDLTIDRKLFIFRRRLAAFKE